ncbi:polysaccharide deacetylase family protein [Rossellomorea marisflavi]|uniref:Polysaccharide deacetylase family protein n=1 Tax=Rossellomorea marisflavi TaxID=189381 RepID=A0A5D4RSU3_9BACI|nr:polysaccharide deacetylase family protein [Rossellomorea marisflavi]MDW4526538.1 polysaccharide deacetylase family protein [Rossellomorea marisflavi]TYS54357.1 polysaccharide deacetylase family protein [Rossellomorea marisflavi]UKS67494.1 polysaccharide deacetylase family protein [Rossellomorea marisflavi]WJV21168.1 polysaccharide deacetylase family protein [Rossellomorea marisflavi]
MGRKYLIALPVIAILTLAAVQNPWTNQYVAHLKGQSVTTTSNKSNLMQQIEEKASGGIKPQDAMIDPVWKATPGYNGIDLDIDASYKQMKKTGTFDDDKLVWKQLKPSKHLEDLPPSPVYRGNPEKPMAAFIINVAWGNEYIPDMLETLKKHQVYATFFLEGRWVKNNPKLARMIVEAGHEVGNHSYSHPDMKSLQTSKVRDELKRTNDIIEVTTGEKVKWFAPPSGSYRDEVVEIADEMDMRTIMWSVDTIDWQKPSPDVLIDRVMGKMHKGAIVLMHPTASTANALNALIVQVKEKELRLGTVSSLMKEERILEEGDNSP